MMEDFNDDFLPPITHDYFETDEHSPTYLLAILFLIMSIIACCNFSISGAIGSFMDTGEIVFPVANTIPEGGKRGFTQAETCLMDMSASLLLASLIIFLGKESDGSLDGYKKYLFWGVILFLTLGGVEERIDFQTDTGFLWYSAIYQTFKYGYFLLCSAIYYCYCYTGKSPIRLNGSYVHLVIFYCIPTLLGRFLMVSVLPTI